VKPFEPEELSQIVERVVRTQTLRRTTDLLRLERGAGAADGPILTPADPEISSPPPASPAGEPTNSLREAERRHIVALLRKHAWNISQTAKALGIDRVTLYNKIKRYQIRVDE
jgi:DNA-binding NtrC family response regulator